MDTLTHNGATLSGTAVVTGQTPARSGTFTTKDLKWGNTFLNQQCNLNYGLKVKVTKETTDAQYSTVMEWIEIREPNHRLHRIPHPRRVRNPVRRNVLHGEGNEQWKPAGAC